MYVSTVESEIILNLLGGLIESFDGSHASTDTDWLSVVMISDLIESSVEVIHVEVVFDFVRLDGGWCWAFLSSDDTECHGNELEHFSLVLNK